jgi:hypothetical protein
MFEGLASRQPAIADLHLSTRAQDTSASLLTLAVNFSPRAETIIRMVSKLGLRSPKYALYKLSLESPESLAIWVIPLGTGDER